MEMSMICLSGSIPAILGNSLLFVAQNSILKMAHHIPKAPGYYSMMKDGARFFQGLEESVFRNISACKALGKTVSSSFGPMGMNKMVINHIEKKFVTKDAATILRELEVAHPAAKIMVLAAQQQEQECGEGTNYVILLTTSLLEKAEELLEIGLSVVNVVEGFEMALKLALTHLRELILEKIDIMDKDKVRQILHCTIQSKIPDEDQNLSKIVADGCVRIMKDNTNFDTDNMRIVKILGGGICNSQLVRGMVFCRDTQGTVKEAINAKVVIYSCPFDIIQTETKGTILINTAAELTAFSNEEENDVETKVKGLISCGIKVVISGGKVGDLLLHYANKYKLLVVKINSKFDLRRLSTVTGASILSNLLVPCPEEIGHVDHVYTDEIGRRVVVIFEQKGSRANIASVVVRGSMDGLLDEAERAVDDAINTYKCLTRENAILAGGGATEIALCQKLLEEADKCADLRQYAIRQFARSFDQVVKALIQNTGLKAVDALTELHHLHHRGDVMQGLVCDKDAAKLGNVVDANVFDLYSVRHWGIKFAADAAISILKVDQVIMARPAGGVAKPKQPGAPNED